MIFALIGPRLRCPYIVANFPFLSYREGFKVTNNLQSRLFLLASPVPLAPLNRGTATEIPTNWRLLLARSNLGLLKNEIEREIRGRASREIGPCEVDKRP